MWRWTHLTLDFVLYNFSSETRHSLISAPYLSRFVIGLPPVLFALFFNATFGRPPVLFATFLPSKPLLLFLDDTATALVSLGASIEGIGSGVFRRVFGSVMISRDSSSQLKVIESSSPSSS